MGKEELSSETFSFVWDVCDIPGLLIETYIQTPKETKPNKAHTLNLLEYFV